MTTRNRSDSSSSPTDPLPIRLAQVTLLFLRLGFTAFGGPAAHIAMFRHEVVQRRRWMDDQRFLDLLGATNLIPGPNSTEMAIHTGFLRAGWAGLLLAGTAFTLPASLIVLGMAWAYVRFGSLPEVGALLYGVKPAIIAVIVQALWSLGKKAVKGPLTALAGLAVAILYFRNVNVILLLIGAGLAVMALQNMRRWRASLAPCLALPLAGISLAGALTVPFSPAVLFLTFLKIGALLYGSGYVLLAFLRADFVVRLGWLTDQQLIDAIAVGQVTPGPVFTTATFIGYLLGGTWGAILATLGIFLPSFFFVALSNPIIPRLRHSPWAASLLDGVNVASLGLMVAVAWQLGRSALVDPLTISIALISALLLFRFQLNSTWLILAGAAAGLLKAFF